jgi:hypothetical protein
VVRFLSKGFPSIYTRKSVYRRFSHRQLQVSLLLKEKATMKYRYLQLVSDVYIRATTHKVQRHLGQLSNLPKSCSFRVDPFVTCFIDRQYKSVENNMTLKFTSMFMQHLATGYSRRKRGISIIVLLVSSMIFKPLF